MRLWHKDFISVLPKNQLLGQWRECCLIGKNIYEKGYPGHVLVNKIFKFPLSHFIAYTKLVYAEMIKRGYKPDYLKFKKYLFEYDPIDYINIFYGWHDYRYLRQCYYNLEEKYDCGSIDNKEFVKIKTLYENLMRF